MNSGNFRRGRHGALLDVAHFVQETYDFIADFEDLRPDLDDVAREQLLFVCGILLHTGHAAVLFAHVSGSDAQFCEQIPRGLVEFSRVPHHVHVAHVIAVPRMHRAFVCECLHIYFVFRSGGVLMQVLRARMVPTGSRPQFLFRGTCDPLTLF